MSRMSKEDYEKVYAWLKEGKSQSEIGRRLGRSASTINRIASGKHTFKPHDPQVQRCRELMAAVPGIGRVRMAREMGVSLQRARDLLDRVRRVDGVGESNVQERS